MLPPKFPGSWLKETSGRGVDPPEVKGSQPEGGQSPQVGSVYLGLSRVDIIRDGKVYLVYNPAAWRESGCTGSRQLFFYNDKEI